MNTVFHAILVTNASEFVSVLEIPLPIESVLEGWTWLQNRHRLRYIPRLPRSVIRRWWVNLHLFLFGDHSVLIDLLIVLDSRFFELRRFYLSLLLLVDCKVREWFYRVFLLVIPSVLWFDILLWDSHWGLIPATVHLHMPRHSFGLGVRVWLILLVGLWNFNFQKFVTFGTFWGVWR